MKVTLVETYCKQLATLAVQALLEEAVLFPKPGLVDPVSSGAHADMNITSFMQSAASLAFGFYEYAYIGCSTTVESPVTNTEGHIGAAGNRILCEAAPIRRRLRTVGLALEQTMFAATHGINTHKGAVFIFGYLLAAAGRLLAQRQPPALDTASGMPQGCLTAAELFAEVRFLAAGLFDEDMTQAGVKQQPTHGEQMFLQYGCKGIRGEVEAGLPLAARNLAYLSKIAHLPQREAYILTLLHIIAENEDTNVLYRAGRRGLNDLQQRCTTLLAAGLTGQALLCAVEELDVYCMNRNISPGGSADLFAAVLFCRSIVREDSKNADESI